VCYQKGKLVTERGRQCATFAMNTYDDQAIGASVREAGLAPAMNAAAHMNPKGLFRRHDLNNKVTSSSSAPRTNSHADNPHKLITTTTIEYPPAPRPVRGPAAELSTRFAFLPTSPRAITRRCSRSENTAGMHLGCIQAVETMLELREYQALTTRPCPELEDLLIAAHKGVPTIFQPEGNSAAVSSSPTNDPPLRGVGPPSVRENWFRCPALVGQHRHPGTLVLDRPHHRMRNS